MYRRRRYGGLRWACGARWPWSLVTGATRGLGFLIAGDLAREGCRLAICARDEDEVTRAVEDLRQQGAEVLGVPCDVSQRGAVETMVARVTEHYGRIDLLVNNAGVIAAGPVPTMTVQDFEQAMAVMFWGLAYPTLAVLPQSTRRPSSARVSPDQCSALSSPAIHRCGVPARPTTEPGASGGWRSGAA